MKLKYKLSTFFLTGLLLTSSCTSDLEDLDVDLYGVTDEELKQDFNYVGAFFQPIFLGIYKYDPAWQAQLQENLNADLYSGYMTNPRPFIAGTNNGTYALVDGWNDFIWTIPYTNVMGNTKFIKERAETEFPILYGLSLILKVEAMHRLSDVFGPIIYTDFGKSELSASYDSQKTAYYQFFSDLEEAIDLISEDLSSDQFQNFDLVYGGDLAKWGKFANSLRLRLALRISNVDPQKAKEEGEKSLNHSIGLIETNSENFIIDGGLTHPLVTFNSSWDDTRMNASMESIMGGYEDARLSVYFQKSGVVPGEYKGIRNGLPLLPQFSDEIAQKADYVSFSKLGSNYDGALTPTTKVQLMTAAEVYFLKSEAALKNWTNAGDVKSNYEMGITTSFEQHGVGIGDYLTSSKLPKNYVDPVHASNSINAMSTISPSFDEATSDEEKLEKIITQKWIAMFPDGQEAWSEYRRTGYPKIFPVVSNQSGGTIDTNEQIKRINFPLGQRNNNPEGVAEAVQLLGGPDTGGTALWWDVN